MRKLMASMLIALCLSVSPLSIAQQSVSLLTAAGATSAQKLWPGGGGVFKAVGTFGGATISLQFLGPDATTWIDAGQATTLTANGAGVFYLPRGQIRAAVTGGSGVSVTVTAEQLATYIG
jgi:hypothetical protein